MLKVKIKKQGFEIELDLKWEKIVRNWVEFGD